MNSIYNFLPFLGKKSKRSAYDRFIEIQSNLRRRKLHRTNEDSNFIGDSFSNIDNVRASIQFSRERQH